MGRLLAGQLAQGAALRGGTASRRAFCVRFRSVAADTPAVHGADPWGGRGWSGDAAVSADAAGLGDARWSGCSASGAGGDGEEEHGHGTDGGVRRGSLQHQG